jgi:hypothetical protein
MESNQPEGVKRKTRERKLRSDLNWQRALKQKRCKTKGRKTRRMCNLYAFFHLLTDATRSAVTYSLIAQIA